ncbi:hypothetical protein HOG21_04745 [bacterium]|nr:hypothetical protein [bacterium]
MVIFNTLMEIKENADMKVLDNPRMMNNESYFTGYMSPIVINSFENNKVTLDSQSAQNINGYAVKEYLNEFNNIKTW